MSRILFITWDGPQTSYLTGLFLPILVAISRSGHESHVLQFTWGSNQKIAETKYLCELEGVRYRAIRVRRMGGGIGPFLTAVLGSLAIRRAVRDWKIDLLMPRSLMPALSVLCLRVLPGTAIVFDADGFAADERVDFCGLSRKSITYRLLKWLERNMVRRAHSVMVRTARAAVLLQNDAGADAKKFFIVKNGRDPANYTGERPSQSDASLRLCYAGSIGVQYLPDRMLAFSRALRSLVPGTTLELLTGDIIKAKEALQRVGLTDADWIAVRHVPQVHMAKALKSCDLAFALRKVSFSSQGVSPIKIGEYLMAGLPIIGTTGVGDVEPLVEAGVMFPLEENDEAAMRWVIETFIPQQSILSAEARRLGIRLYGIDRSVSAYEAAIEYAVRAARSDEQGAYRRLF